MELNEVRTTHSRLRSAYMPGRRKLNIRQIEFRSVLDAGKLRLSNGIAILLY